MVIRWGDTNHILARLNRDHPHLAQQAIDGKESAPKATRAPTNPLTLSVSPSDGHTGPRERPFEVRREKA